MPSEKEIIAELIESAREFRMAGPSDDPDAQTATTLGYRHLLVQFKRLAAPLLSDEAAFRLNGLEINVDDIYTAYDVRAELEAMLPDIENALAVFDEAPEVASGIKASIVDPALIDGLAKIKSSHADTGTLVRMCREINSSHMHGNVLATVLLMRAVLNHVPPVFGVETFEQVVANGGKSQRENFEHLENGLRKIADFHTHRKIEPVENYPSVRQVEPYKPQFEMLLHEIEANLRDESRRKLPVKSKLTDNAKPKREKRDDGEKELRDWQARHEVVAIQLSKINPHFAVRYPDDSTRIIYTQLFPDVALCRAIELYIIEVDRGRTVFTPRKPTAHELHSPALRETVKTVEARLARFCEDNPTVSTIFKS